MTAAVSMAPRRHRLWAAGLLVSVSLLSAEGARPQVPAALPSPLELDDAVRIARVHRPEVAAARSRARAAGHRPVLVASLEDPMLSPAIDHWPYGMGEPDVSIAVEQRFPLAGVRGQRRRSAEAEARRAQTGVEQTALDVELEAATAFLMLYERRQMQRVIGEQHELAAQYVAATNARYGAGMGAQAEVLQAEAERARLGGLLQALRGEIASAEVMLNVSLARPANDTVPELESPGPGEPPPSAATVATQALAQRPELQGGDAELRQALAEIQVMRSMYAPMAILRAGTARTMESGPGAMLMVGISLPIWRSKLRAGVEEAKAMAEMASYDLEAMRRMIEGEAVAARHELAAAIARMDALRLDVVPRARQAVGPALAGYSSGQLPLASVIQASQGLWSAQAELVEAEVRAAQTRARLRRATGTGGESR